MIIKLLIAFIAGLLVKGMFTRCNSIVELEDLKVRCTCRAGHFFNHKNGNAWWNNREQIVIKG